MIILLLFSQTAALVDCDAMPLDRTPQGVHIAYAGDPASTIRVSFFTCAGPASNATSDGAFVTFLDASTNATVSGSSQSYYSRWQHDIAVDELDAGRLHRYAVQLGAAGPPSRVFSFRTAPAAAAAAGLHRSPFAAIILGDMGVNGSEATLARVAKLTASGASNVTIHVGDVGYADDHGMKLEPSSGRSYEAVYDLFQDSIEAIASSAPYMVCPGNHDVSCHVLSDAGCPKAQRNFSAFRARFTMPSAASHAVDAGGRSVMGMWYSFTVAGVHMVSISTESDFAHAPTTPNTLVGGGKGGGFGDQLAWLEDDLAAARADPAIDFIVVYGHRPWYASKASDWPLDAPRRVQTAFEPIFAAHRVDLYVCGHKHYYERIIAATAGVANAANGTVTIINGAAGNNENLDTGKGVGGLVAAANYVAHGFGVLERLNETALRWRYELSESGEVVDELVLRARHAPFTGGEPRGRHSLRGAEL
jgi:3',5'-cyclic AMP phosphodiesterase CpdA